jgi:hypothetical protein
VARAFQRNAEEQGGLFGPDPEYPSAVAPCPIAWGNLVRPGLPQARPGRALVFWNERRPPRSNLRRHSPDLNCRRDTVPTMDRASVILSAIALAAVLASIVTFTVPGRQFLQSARILGCETWDCGASTGRADKK